MRAVSRLTIGVALLASVGNVGHRLPLRDEPQRLTPAWVVPGEGRGIPAVGRTTAYFLSKRHEVVAIDIRSGRVSWRGATGEPGDREADEKGVHGDRKRDPQGVARAGAGGREGDDDEVHDHIQQEPVGDAERHGATPEGGPAARGEVVGHRHGAGDEEVEDEAERGGGGASLEAGLTEQAGRHRLEDAGGWQIHWKRLTDH